MRITTAVLLSWRKGKLEGNLKSLSGGSRSTSLALSACSCANARVRYTPERDRVPVIF